MAKNSKRAWKLQEFQAHIGMVNCLAIGSKSGKVIVTGGEDKKVNLWAVGKMSCILSLKGHVSSIESVGFNSSEDVVAAGSHSGAMKIWNLEASKILRTLSGHKAGIRSLDFHPFGDIIASGSVDSNIKLWDFRMKNCLFTYKGHTNAINSIQFSPDGKWIASASDDNTVKLWEISSGKMIHDFKDHMAPVTSVRFHPIDFLLAAGSSNRTLKFWDLETFQLVSSTDGDCGAIRAISMHPEGGCVYAACQDYLMSYGWEPAVTFDSVSTGWGRAADIVVHQNELVGGSFHQSCVSIYIADLMKIQPIGSPQEAQSKQAGSTQSGSPFTQNPSRRRSFITKNSSPGHGARQDTSCHRNNETIPLEEPLKGDTGLAYDDIFNPKKELAREQQAIISNNKPLGGNQTSSSCPPISSSSSSAAAAAASDSRKCPSSATSAARSPDDYFRGLQTPIASSTGSATVETSSAPRPCRRPPIGHLFHRANGNNNKPPTTANNNGKEDELGDVSILTSGREGIFNVNIDDFIPKPQHFLSNMDDDEAMSIIRKSHQVHLSLLSNRNKNLQVFKTLLTGSNIKAALDFALSMNDQAILQDVMTILLRNSSSWTLETCIYVLPVVSTLISGRYETHVTTGLTAVKFILRSFAALIKDTLSNVSSIGIDISREERYNRSRYCHRLLMAIRDDLDEMFRTQPQNLQVKEIRLLFSQLD